MQAPPQQEFLSVNEVANILGLSYTKARELMLSNQLETIDVSKPNAKRRCVKVSKENLNKFIEKGGCTW